MSYAATFAPAPAGWRAAVYVLDDSPDARRWTLDPVVGWLVDIHSGVAGPSALASPVVLSPQEGYADSDTGVLYVLAPGEEPDIAALDDLAAEAHEARRRRRQSKGAA